MITITPLANPEGVTQQEYNSSQETLIPVVNSTSEFNPVTDKVVFSVETITGELLTTNKVSNFSVRNYENTLNEDQISSVVVFPTQDIKNSGFSVGVYNVYYNFYRTALKSDQYKFFIQEISPSRTEIRLSVNNVPDEEINSLVEEFQGLLEGEAFKDFYIEINGLYLIANNILVDNTSVPSTILLKLYQPLPSTVLINDQLSIVFETAETVGFNLNLPPNPIKIEGDIEYVKGPNFNYQLSDQINNSTVEENYNSLVDSTELTSSYNELENILNQKGITVNIDYTNFENFVQFSSAEQRLLNFRYKVKQIEDYNNNINSLLSITGSTSSSLQVSSSKATYEAQITDVIKNFDGYENYLYYTSGTLAWPKSNSTQPYTLQSTGSSEVLTWLGSAVESSAYYGGRLLTASLYDGDNLDNLFNTVPTYIKDDPANSGYELFLNMIGQHFDILYSYINTITDRYNADNRLDYGISKDLVADALRSMGMKLYQNNFSSDNLYSALLGINASGSLLPPTGSEIIETYITASNTALPIENINKETYKRLYHNLPYLLKKKGTVEGLRALINCFGIPDTILRISEFGGKDKDNFNDWDYFQNKFNYAIYNSGSSTTSRIQINWDINSNWDSFGNVPESVFLRFKPKQGLPSENTFNTIFHINTTSGASPYLTLDYTGSGYTSSSYSGSIPSSSNDYATLTLWSDSAGGTKITSVDAPFYDGNWWGVQISREGVSSNAEVILRAANSIYNGNDGFKVGHTTSSTVTNNLSEWTSPFADYIYFSYDDNASVSLGGNDYYGLTGSFQEVRFYNVTQSENTFHDYVMNPYSIEGLNYSSSADNLIFRAPLGSDLNTSTGTLTSIHPKVTGSNTTHSFASDSDYTVGGDLVYYPQTEFVYYDQPAVGIKNRISEKIRLADNIIPSGDTLTPYRTIQQRYPQSESYTRDVNYVEVAFSPQNEINDDINSSFGYFNIGDYIGDPRQVSESTTSYPDLDKLRDDYFEKYYTSYDWKDYVRLIKYFDNSLFKMIKDFVPAKSSLATGVVIKQHLLERNKQRPAQVESSQHDYSGSIDTVFISGGSAGIYDDLLEVSPQVTQSWIYTVDTPSGSLIVTQSTQDEFYNGELSGSTILATNGDLNSTIVQETADVTEGFIAPYNQVYQTGSNAPFIGGGSDGDVLYSTDGVDGVGGTLLTSLTFYGNDSNGDSRFNYLSIYNRPGYRVGDILQIRTKNGSYPNTYNFVITAVEQKTPPNVPPLATKFIIEPYFIFSPTTDFLSVTEGGQSFELEFIFNPIIANLQTNILGDEPLQNNAVDPRLSTIFDDVDYSTGTIVPTNIGVIGTDEATKAPISDSNYSQTAWKNGRYVGSRGSSLDFNE